MKRLLPLAAVLLLSACAGTPKKAPPAAVSGPLPPVVAGAVAADCSDFVPYPAAQEDLSTRGDYVAGGLYKPGVSDSTPDYLPRVDCIAEPFVAHEPRSRLGNRTPYQVLGKSYRVLDSVDGFVETGLASYYGNKFHGRRTSNHEVYDMYAFTAAHKSLPLPSFARVTNLDNGRSVVVRVNDRGPFHEGRVIDLSYAAAVRLDIHRRGTGRVEVRALTPGQAQPPTQLAAAAAAPVRDSAMDGLVQALPQPPSTATTVAAVTAPALMPASITAAAPSTPAATAAPAPRAADLPGYGLPENRFELVKDGRVRSADEFDAWMKARQEREQAWRQQYGTPATPSVAGHVAPVPAPSSAAPAVTPRPVIAGPSMTALPAGTWLQVGVFSVRENADGAIARLRAAGIASATLQDVVSGGRQVWRVRIGPVAADAVGELSSRVAGLGFGTPHIVRD